MLTDEQAKLYAERYRALRQMFKNREVSLQTWGLTFKGKDWIDDEDELDEFLNAITTLPRLPAAKPCNNS